MADTIAKPIVRGTFFMTDAFAQAQAFSDLQILKIVAIELPEWSSNSGIFLTSPEVGLAAGILDPNILLAEAMHKYWLNLTRLATESGAFAEQAFIKLLYRLQSGGSGNPASMLRAESSDYLVLNGYSDNLLTRKLTFRLSSNTNNVTAGLVTDKPEYLLTDRLPLSDTDNMVGSDYPAMYDSGLPYYNVQDSECQRFALQPANRSSFTFNAILVYFNDDGIEDLGGVYFTEAYRQVGQEWRMPSKEKHDNTAFDFDVTLIAYGTDFVQYTANEPALPSAMRQYEKMFQDRTSSVSRMNRMDSLLASMQEQLNSIDSLISLSDISRLQQLNDALNLIDNGDRIALLRSAMLLATDGQIPEDFIVPSDVGNYNAGDIIPAGTDINAILNNIFA